MCYVMAPSAASAEHQSGEPFGLPVQSFEQMTEGTSALHSDSFYCTMPNVSSSTCYVMAPSAASAEHQSGEQPGLPVQSFEQMTGGTSALHSSWFYYTMCEEATEVETHHQQTATTMGVAEDETPSSLTSSHPNTNNPNQEDKIEFSAVKLSL
ncbi:uncharacterized protein LOC112460983 [Temnothorax curvispinosus]|uniref:Uncharacterized protein LOC112460983 n=1 Tax=Temnothorax curvispinosus TaxID=300111 RepID=A0A6J1QIR8_9HYME|nr:uncharacterized protein LOC112460983 [Temnothorax curvispinosus]